MLFKERITDIFKFSKEEVVDKYNKLIDYFNKHEEERLSELYFLRSMIESSPYAPNESAVRGINVSIYLSDESAKEEVLSCVHRIIYDIGHVIIYDYEISGSWWKRITTRAKRFVTQDEVQKELDKVKKHVENLTVNKSQADLDTNLASSISTLLESTKDQECLLLINSIILVRHKESDGELKTIVKVLTTEELLVVSMEQSLLSKPASFFHELESLVKEFREREEETETIYVAENSITENESSEVVYIKNKKKDLNKDEETDLTKS